MDFKLFLNILQSYVHVRPLTVIILNYLYDEKYVLISILMKEPILLKMHNKLISISYDKLSEKKQIYINTTPTDKMCNTTKCNYTGKNFDRLWLDIKQNKFKKFQIIGQHCRTFEDDLLNFLFIQQHHIFA